MGVLKTTKREYEFSLENMKQLIAADIGVSTSEVHVDYVMGDIGLGDPMDRYPTPQGVVSIKVTVNEQPRVAGNSLGRQIAAVESDRRPMGDK
jgi:hypothetical protein